MNGRAAGMVTAQLNADKEALAASLEDLSLDEFSRVLAELTMIAGYAVHVAAAGRRDPKDLWREMLTSPTLRGLLDA